MKATFKNLIKSLNQYSDMANHSFVTEALDGIHTKLVSPATLLFGSSVGNDVANQILDVKDTKDIHILTDSVSNLTKDIKAVMLDELGNNSYGFLMMNTYCLYGLKTVQGKHKYATITYGLGLDKRQYQKYPYVYKGSDGVKAFIRPASAKDVDEIVKNLKNEFKKLNK